MNFLGHLYFSGTDLELMHCNLYGDYVRGSNLTHLAPKIQEGIRLHRNIDHYMDTHPAVLEAKRQLSSQLPKVSGIAIDLIFDHLLARDWQTHHPLDYHLYLRQFYTHQATHHLDFSPAFQSFLSVLKSRQWMNFYPSLYGLQKSCEGVATRLSFESKLSATPTVFIQEEALLVEAFQTYMQDAKRQFLTQ
ncbi:MAG: hypothetical protein RLZZ301_827 [Bacteroidota bacterium]|jgi:acyl carrier protein phosphodiesterase